MTTYDTGPKLVNYVQLNLTNLGTKFHENHQGREAVLSSSSRNRETSMSTSIRSSEGLAEHVWRHRFASTFHVLLFFNFSFSFPFTPFLLTLLHTKKGSVQIIAAPKIPTNLGLFQGNPIAKTIISCQIIVLLCKVVLHAANVVHCFGNSNIPISNVDRNTKTWAGIILEIQ